jgi:hypothetical protein
VGIKIRNYDRSSLNLCGQDAEVVGPTRRGADCLYSSQPFGQLGQRDELDSEGFLEAFRLTPPLVYLADGN